MKMNFRDYEREKQKYENRLNKYANKLAAAGQKIF